MDATTTSSGSDPARYTTALLAPFVDAWIAARVRFALLVAGGSALGNVNVEAIRGSVILSGDVGSRADCERAERVVRAYGGAVGVSNRIRVRGAHRLRPGASDAEIRASVTARLRNAPELRGSIVTIESVYDGVVRLVGVAENTERAALAFDLVVDVPGVRRVINDVGSRSAREDDADAA